MDEETTNHALSKVRAMRLVIAYPDFFVARGFIEDQYKGVSKTRVTVHPLLYDRNKLHDI
jgi:hypothetical protein